MLAHQSDNFFTAANLLNQGRLMTEVGLVALPMTFVIVTGGIDLSVGSILGLWPSCSACSGTISACRCLSPWCWPWPAAPSRPGQRPHHHPLQACRPLIATLATLALYRGLAEGISQARSVRGYPEWFFVLGQGEVLGVPTQLWILVIFALIAAVILGLTHLRPRHLCRRRQRDGSALFRHSASIAPSC